MEDTDKPLIILSGLEDNVPMELTETQLLLQQHSTELIWFWWAIWWTTALYLIYIYLARPLYKQYVISRQQKQANPQGE
jgi:hypothetical protein